ncbi:MAG: class I SAM-dependent methyltransferase [Erythrobacter sp.]|uniref:class I SAM-dependent methyltransferase n=1 Tax=Erythrobacter sp. TaxID=1042 RepID=UPI0025D68DF0|nr:class I SAM-dependent methyltransferase [Erythrobacter sp.]MCM0000377.1 class I SAM-dependent methyltransferase [Erythrobacter sp.]
MTTKSLTGLLAMPSETGPEARRTRGEQAFQIAFGAVQWPWLLRSLYGGTQAEKQRLLARLALAGDSLPNLGSWKADTYLLHRIVDIIEETRPATVVELGSGATSLVIAQALALHGGGALHSYDSHAPFVTAMEAWLAEHGRTAAFRHAPLVQRDVRWPGLWYALTEVPGPIDLLVIDGPPWAVHPFARGMAERLFPLVAPGGTVLLDDAARPGERYVARRWRKAWPDFTFRYEGAGTKGLLVGTRRSEVRR